MAPTIKTDFINNGTGFIAIVENVDGEKYLLSANSLNEIIDDWRGNCEFVPENGSKVYFAMLDGKIISTYEITNFESLVGYLMGYYGIA